MAGLTANGLEVRTQAEIQALLEDAMEAALPGVNWRAGPLQQFIGILSEELAVGWEALAALYAAPYPDSATGILLDQVAALTGTTRRAATRSTVTATVNLNAGVTLPAGSIAAVAGNPDAQFRTMAAATNGGGSPANVSVAMESVQTGPVAAPALTLTAIVTPATGWNTVSNTGAATLGLELATDAELRTTRLIELAGAGSGTVAALRAAVIDVDGIVEVTVYENISIATVSGRPGKSFEVVLWDGATPAASNTEVAQAIWDHKPAGIETHGGTSASATTDTGATTAVEFTRASSLRVYVSATCVLAPGTGAGWQAQVQAAVVARADEYTVGETAYASQLVAAILDAVPAVVAVTALTLGTSASPVGASVVPTYSQIVRVATADVVVT